MYAGLIVLVGLVAMNTQNNLLFWALGVLAAGLVLSIVLSWIILINVRVRRLDPQHGAVGEPLVVRYRMTNKARWTPVFNLHCEELPVTGRIKRTPRRRDSPRARRARAPPKPPSRS